MKAVFVVPFSRAFQPVNDREGSDGVLVRSRLGSVPVSGVDTNVEYIEAPDDVVAEMEANSSYIRLFLPEVTDA